MLSDGADLTRAGHAFQALTAATGKAQSPSVERLGDVPHCTVAQLQSCKRSRVC